MRKFKTATAALLAAAAVVVGVANQDAIHWQSPEEIRAQEQTDPSKDMQNYPGFPAEMEGEWVYEDESGNLQKLTMRGTQLIIQDPNQGTLYYDGVATQGNSEEKLSADHPVMIVWDTDLYVDRYGEDQLGPGPQPFMFSYDESNDTLQSSPEITFKRDETAELLWTIKNNLAGMQPVSLEQLRNVDDELLLNLWQEAQDSGFDDATTWRHLYTSIDQEHDELDLLAAEDYDRYYELAESISANSDYSFSDLNTALPKNVLAWYEATAEELDTEDPAEITAAILPQITEARDEYLVRRMSYENSLYQPQTGE